MYTDYRTEYRIFTSTISKARPQQEMDKRESAMLVASIVAALTNAYLALPGNGAPTVTPWQHATRCAAVGKLATMRPHLANAAVAGARPTRLRHEPLSMLCLCLCSHQSDPLRVTCPPTVPSLVAPRGNDHTWCAPHCLPTRRRARTTTARAYVRAFPGVQLHALSRSVTTGCLARAQGRA